MPERFYDENGVYRHSEESKRRMSESQRKRHEQLRREMPRPTKGQKKCTRCGVRKPFDLENKSASGFYFEFWKNADGSKTYYPAGVCKECQRKATKERMAAKSPEERKALRKKWHEADTQRDPERVRRRNREAQANKRRREGVPVRGPWMKYRGLDEKVPIGPFRDWIIEQRDKRGFKELVAILPIPERRVTKIINGYEMKKGKKYPIENIGVDTVDRCLLAEGNTLLSELYPSLYHAT